MIEAHLKETLFFTADECVTRSILTTVPLKDHNRVVHKKSDFMFGDAAPGTDQQLLTREDQ